MQTYSGDGMERQPKGKCRLGTGLFLSIFMKIAVAAVLVYIGSVLWMSLRENQYLYYPKKYPKEFIDPDRMGLRFENVVLTLPDGVDVHGWWLPGSGGEGSPVVLFFHGNAGHIADRMDLIRLLLSRPIVPLGGVLIPDYPGFGKSSGRPGEAACYETARAYYGYLRETLHVDSHRIVLFGRSLGAAVALETAVKYPCAGLVIEVPFLSIPRMAEKYYPLLPGLKYIVRQKFDNEKKIGRLRVPLMMVVAGKDDVVGADQGYALFELAPEPKRLVSLPDAKHSNTYLSPGGYYWTSWSAFLKSLGFGKDSRKKGETEITQDEDI